MSHNVIHEPGVGVGRTTRRVGIITTAAVVNALAWVGGRHAHVDYVVQTPLGPRQITLLLVVVATTVSGLAGWAVFGLLERHTSNSLRAWILLAALVLGLSIAPIFVLPAALSTRLSLTALHCIAAVVLTAGLPQTR